MIHKLLLSALLFTSFCVASNNGIQGTNALTWQQRFHQAQSMRHGYDNPSATKAIGFLEDAEKIYTDLLKDPNINNSQRASVNRELSKINGRMAQILERFERTPHFSKQAEQYQSRQINDSYNLNPDDPRTCLQMGYVTSNLQCYQRGLNNVNPHQSPGLYAQLQRNLNQRIVKDRRAMTALQQPRQHHHRMSNRGRRGYQRKGMNRPRRTTFQKRKTYYGPTHHHNRRNRGGFSR